MSWIDGQIRNSVRTKLRQQSDSHLIAPSSLRRVVVANEFNFDNEFNLITMNSFLCHVHFFVIKVINSDSCHGKKCIFDRYKNLAGQREMTWNLREERLFLGADSFKIALPLQKEKSVTVIIMTQQQPNSIS